MKYLQPETEDLKTIEFLKSKDVFYMKPDKGNGIVVLDRSDYEERMEKLIREGAYEEIVDGRLINNNPVNVMQNKLKSLLKNLVEDHSLNRNFAQTLTVSNPSVPMLYGLPKIHKSGNKMRPIVSCCNSPTSKLSKWVSHELEDLNITMEFEVKNTQDLVERLKNIKIQDDELLVSFDVVALFPSIPVEKAVNTMKYHISRQNISSDKKSIIIKSVETCMALNQFQFRGKFYRQLMGAAIGNSLSPKVASFFMLHFENKVKRMSWFPRVWLRYVDDVFAIVKKTEVKNVLEQLCDQFESIDFTVEEEIDEKLPFLDVLIAREAGELKFSIYRKPTATKLYIPEDSHHSKSHKMAAFNSMFHRLFSIPMNQQDFENERSLIMDTAKVNGYNRKTMEKLFEKHQKKKDIQNLTSLEPINDREFKYISMPFHPPLTHKLDNELKKFGYKVAYQNEGKLAALLGSTKDKITDDGEKSGIYQIQCANCDVKYIGQTKRKMKTRIKEHFEDCKKPPNEEKPMAKHAIENSHVFGEVKLLEEVRQPFKLNACESFHLHKHKNENLVNVQLGGNCPSVLFNYV